MAGINERLALQAEEKRKRGVIARQLQPPSQLVGQSSGRTGVSARGVQAPQVSVPQAPSSGQAFAPGFFTRVQQSMGAAGIDPVANTPSDGGNFLSSAGSFFGNLGMGALDVLDTPRAAIVSGIKEAQDFVSGEGFSGSDWLQQTRDNIGFGDVMPSPTGNRWVDRGIGFLGDVLLDPLTYLAGAGVIAGTGRSARAGAAARVGMLGDDAIDTLARQAGRSFDGLADDALTAARRSFADEVGQRIGREGVAHLDDATRKVLREAQVSQIKDAGYYFKLPFIMDDYKRVPMTANLDRKIGQTFGRARERLLQSTPFRRTVGIRPGVAAGESEALRVLLTGSGDMTFRQAAAVYLQSNGLRRNSKTFLSSASRQAELAYKGVKPAESPQLIHAAEQGVDNVVRQTFDKLYKQVTAAGVELPYREGYVPHMFTADMRKWITDKAPKFQNTTKNLEAFFEVDPYGTPTFRRNLNVGEEVDLFGKRVEITDGSIAGMNRLFREHFPEAGKIKMFDDDLNSLTQRWIEEMSQDVGRILTARELAKTNLGMFSMSDDIFDEVIDEGLKKRLTKEATAELFNNRRQAKEMLAALRADQENMLTELNSTVMDHFDTILNEMHEVGVETKAKIQAVSDKLREITNSTTGDLAAVKEEMDVVMREAMDELTQREKVIIDRIRRLGEIDDDRVVRLAGESTITADQLDEHMQQLADLALQRKALADLDDRIAMAERGGDAAMRAYNSSPLVNAFRAPIDTETVLADLPTVEKIDGVWTATGTQGGVAKRVRLDTPEKVSAHFQAQRAATVQAAAGDRAVAALAEREATVVLQRKRYVRAAKDAEEMAISRRAVVQDLDENIVRQQRHLTDLENELKAIPKGADMEDLASQQRALIASAREQLNRLQLKRNNFAQTVQTAQQEAMAQREMYLRAAAEYKRAAARTGGSRNRALDKALDSINRAEADALADLTKGKTNFGSLYFEPTRIPIVDPPPGGWRGYAAADREELARIEGILAKGRNAGRADAPTAQRIRELRGRADEIRKRELRFRQYGLDPEVEALADNLTRIWKGQEPFDPRAVPGLADEVKRAKAFGQGSAGRRNIYRPDGLEDLVDEVMEMGTDMLGGTLDRASGKPSLFDRMLDDGWMTDADVDIFRRQIKRVEELRNAKPGTWRTRELRQVAADARIQIDFANRMALATKMISGAGFSPADFHPDSLGNYVMTRVLASEIDRAKKRAVTLGNKAEGKALRAEMREFSDKALSLHERIGLHQKNIDSIVDKLADESNPAEQAQLIAARKAEMRQVRELSKQLRTLNSPVAEEFNEVVESAAQAIYDLVGEYDGFRGDARSVHNMRIAEMRKRPPSEVAASSDRISKMHRDAAEKLKQQIEWVRSQVENATDGQVIEAPGFRRRDWTVNIWNQDQIDKALAATPEHMRQSIEDRIIQKRKWQRATSSRQSGETERFGKLTTRVDESIITAKDPKAAAKAARERRRLKTTEGAERRQAANEHSWHADVEDGTIGVSLDEAESYVNHMLQRVEAEVGEARRAEFDRLAHSRQHMTWPTDGELMLNAYEQVLEVVSGKSSTQLNAISRRWREEMNRFAEQASRSPIGSQDRIALQQMTMRQNLLESLEGAADADIARLARDLEELQRSVRGFQRTYETTPLSEQDAYLRSGEEGSDFIGALAIAEDLTAPKIAEVLNGQRQLTEGEMRNLSMLLGAEEAEAAKMMMLKVRDAMQSELAGDVRRISAVRGNVDAALGGQELTRDQLTDIADIVKRSFARRNGETDAIVDQVFMLDAADLGANDQGFVTAFQIGQSLLDSMDLTAEANRRMAFNELEGALNALGIKEAMAARGVVNQINAFDNQIGQLKGQVDGLLAEYPRITGPINARNAQNRALAADQAKLSSPERQAMLQYDELTSQLGALEAQKALWEGDLRTHHRQGAKVLNQLGYNPGNGDFNFAQTKRYLLAALGNDQLDVGQILKAKLTDTNVRISRLEDLMHNLGGDIAGPPTAGAPTEIIDELEVFMETMIGDLPDPAEVTQRRIALLEQQIADAEQAGDQELHRQLVDELEEVTDGTAPIIDVPTESVFPEGGFLEQERARLTAKRDEVAERLLNVQEELNSYGASYTAPDRQKPPKGRVTQAELEQKLEAWMDMPEGPARDAARVELDEAAQNVWRPANADTFDPALADEVRDLRRQWRDLSDLDEDLNDQLRQLDTNPDMTAAMNSQEGMARLRPAEDMNARQIDQELQQLAAEYRQAAGDEARMGRIAARITALTRQRNQLLGETKTTRIVPRSANQGRLKVAWRDALQGFPTVNPRDVGPNGLTADIIGRGATRDDGRRPLGRILQSVNEDSFQSDLRKAKRRGPSAQSRAQEAENIARQERHSQAKRHIEGVAERKRSEEAGLRTQRDQLAQEMTNAEASVAAFQARQQRSDPEMLRQRFQARQEALEAARDDVLSQQNRLWQSHVEELERIESGSADLLRELDSLRDVGGQLRRFEEIDRKLSTKKKKMAGPEAIEYIDDLRDMMTLRKAMGMEDADFEATAVLLNQADELARKIATGEGHVARFEQAIKDAMTNPELAAKATKAVLKDGWTAIKMSAIRQDLDDVGLWGVRGQTVAINDELNKVMGRIEVALQKPATWKIIDKYSQLFKTYATGRPGFHVRNAMSATFMNLVDGVRLKYMRRAPGLWREFMRSPEAFWTKYPAGTAVHEAMQATLGSGAGGQFLETAMDAAGATGRIYNRLIDNKYTKVNRKAGGYVEGPVRLAMGLDSIAKGMTADQALERITKFHFDYSQVSRLDQTAKKFIPFWTFMSRNIPLQLEQMWTNPQMYLAFERLQENFGEEASRYVPSYWLDQGAFTMDENIGPDESGWYLNFDLPHTRVMEPFEKLGSGDLAGALVSDLNPLFGAPIEAFGLGRKAFSGAPIEGYERPSGAGTMAMLPLLRLIGGTEQDSQGNTVVDQRFAHILRSLNPVHEMADRLTPRAEGTRAGRTGETVLRLLGAPVLKLTPELQEQTQRTQRFEQREAQRRQREIDNSK